MAKKRYVSEELGMNDDVNLLSDFEERVFVRCISIADDYGVLPQSITMLRKRIGFESDRHQDVVNALDKIYKVGLLRVIEYNGKDFYSFSPQRFDKDQSHIKGKRTQSEYVGIKADTREDFEEEIISKNFVENPRNVPPLEVLKYKDISIKSKAESLKSETKKFQVPTLEEVTEEFRGRGHPEPKDIAETMIAYYEIRDWMVNGRKVKSWKACVTTFMKNEKKGFGGKFLSPNQITKTGYKPPETNTNLPAYKPYVDKTRDVKREPMPQDIRTLLQGV